MSTQQPIQGTFTTEIETLREQLIAWRRDFHQHPELGFQEHRTASVIADVLRRAGCRVQTGIAHTGVVGVLEGAAPGPVVMARFDIDALPITEENDLPYASQNPSVMHACGHDAHIAIGLGVATLMARRQAQMHGTLKLIFQPGEEGMNGAAVMVQEGVMENPRPDIFIAAHVWTDRPVGMVDVTPGPVTAAAEKWTCLIQGKGGHSALPHQTVDPIAASAQVITALQTVVSRNVSPQEAAVVTVSTLHGGDAFNIIPSKVTLSGTIRTYNPSVRETVLQRVREIVVGVTSACGATADLELIPLTPAVVNDPTVTEAVHRAAKIVVGAENVTSGERTMGSEDAAVFMQDTPGCYFFLGAANPQAGIQAPHHNPRFNIAEEVLPIGVAVFMETLAGYFSVKA